ncbi:hypothetical protein CYLTODRAFT_485587 [Cylindrobasidium torrendii FP15055 ss-10]|uniref:Uncharacterized protein n=1 Tax=Cylindrobasidium torrendii FP15055 ss-10 TaxID=1314674 RepID=A0A0D7BSQ6_9AGAR|nr:hypothetical protein CYLTODRAFT_485587 [Cylindrobasidium torrendii FP15055 ss-10]
MHNYYYSPASDVSSSSRQSASVPAVSTHPNAYSPSWSTQQQRASGSYNSLFDIYGYAPESPWSEPEELDEDDSASYLDDEAMDTEEDFSASPISPYSPQSPFASRTVLSGLNAPPSRTSDASRYPDASTSRSAPQSRRPHGWTSHTHGKAFHGSPQYAYNPETGIEYAYEHGAACKITDAEHSQTCSGQNCPCTSTTDYYAASSDSDGLTTTTFSSPDSSPQSEASHPSSGPFPYSPLSSSPRRMSPYGDHNNAQPRHIANPYPASASTQTYVYSKPQPFTSSLLPPPPPELPLHQPRPTRRFNVHKLDDLAASYAQA